MERQPEAGPALSHADRLLAIIERERVERDANDKHPALTAAIRRAHDTELESARQIEEAEAVLAAIHAAKHETARRTLGWDPTCEQLGCR